MNNYKNFIEIEETNKYYKIRHWQSLRPYIYDCFCSIVRTSSRPPVKGIVIQIINSLICKKVLRRKKVDIYFGIPRLINSEYYDEGKKSMQYKGDFIYINQSKTNNKITLEHTTPSTLLMLISKIISVFYKSFNSEISSIKKEINVLERKLREIVIYNQLFYVYFYFLLKRLKPKYIFYTRGDNFYALLQACDKLKIKSIEFQHGDIVEEEVSISHRKEIKEFFYSPDILLVYSQIWTKDLYIGEKTKSISIGKDIRKIKEDPFQYLILIDTFINQEQIKFIDNFKELTKIPIILKVHPNHNYSSISIHLLKKFKQNSITIIHKEVSFEELLTRKTIVIGSYSTSIYFALSHGVKVYYINSDFRKINQADKFKNFLDFNCYKQLLDYFNNFGLPIPTNNDKNPITFYDSYDIKILNSIDKFL